MQPSHDDGAFLLVGGPVVAAAAKGKEGHAHATHLVHRVETVGHKREVGVFLAQVLGVESAHRHGSHLHAEAVGHPLEMGGLKVVAQLVVESLALAKRTHVQLDAIAAQLLGQFECT